MATSLFFPLLSEISDVFDLGGVEFLKRSNEKIDHLIEVAAIHHAVVRVRIADRYHPTIVAVRDVRAPAHPSS